MNAGRAAPAADTADATAGVDTVGTAVGAAAGKRRVGQALAARVEHEHRAGQRMVGQRGDEDAPDDGPGPAKAGGQQHRQQLRLVAHFGKGDECGGGKQSFHQTISGAGRK